ncbi:hypothetical protein HRbin40_01655 [bacterium HR40]|nr:hypothetical protein HRbin40_01655 [bacterium HR40]
MRRLTFVGGLMALLLGTEAQAAELVLDRELVPPGSVESRGETPSWRQLVRELAAGQADGGIAIPQDSGRNDHDDSSRDWSEGDSGCCDDGEDSR